MGTMYGTLARKVREFEFKRFGENMIAATSSDEIGDRITEWLRSMYPKDGAKLSALDFDASPNTTKKWFYGARPANEHFDAMAARWGWRFLSFVYQGVLPEPPSSDDLGAELQELKGLLARLEGRIGGNSNVGGLAQ